MLFQFILLGLFTAFYVIFAGTILPWIVAIRGSAVYMIATYFPIGESGITALFLIAALTLFMSVVLLFRSH